MPSAPDNKEKILDKARSHFLRHGYLNASLRKIARDAGVTTGALYHHFRGKDELFVEVCLNGFALMNRKFESAEKMTAGRPPEDRIMAFFDAYVSFFFEHRDYYELIERLQHNQESLRIPEALIERAHNASEASIAAMIRAVGPFGTEAERDRGVQEALLLVAVAEGLFQCARKGLLDRAGVAFGHMRALIFSKLPGLLAG
jgi:AcrR family transcriptional regulator